MDYTHHFSILALAVECLCKRIEKLEEENKGLREKIDEALGDLKELKISSLDRSPARGVKVVDTPVSPDVPVTEDGGNIGDLIERGGMVYAIREFFDSLTGEDT